jgi:hypothetical protein
LLRRLVEGSDFGSAPDLVGIVNPFEQPAAVDTVPLADTAPSDIVPLVDTVPRVDTAPSVDTAPRVDTVPRVDTAPLADTADAVVLDAAAIHGAHLPSAA